MLRYLLLCSLILAVAIAEDPKSPCPGKFDYVESKEGQWTGTLTLDSEYSLHGLWLRVFFDRAVKKLEPVGEIKEVRTTDDDAKNFLITNRDYLLKKNTPTKVTFTVTYEGEERPELIGYRINARDVCPEGRD
ncbi:uncharacterized protein [Atheta coriaria]|uniref:uncharacterized protein n=1 Tax=Dalotia coriaria TaxID=877792 RepID=UPI0031F3A474